jgi:hypothetical protein
VVHFRDQIPSSRRNFRRSHLQGPRFFGEAACQAGVRLLLYPDNTLTACEAAGAAAIPDTGDISQGVAGCEARLDSRPFPGLVCCRKKAAPHKEHRAKFSAYALAQYPQDAHLVATGA